MRTWDHARVACQSFRGKAESSAQVVAVISISPHNEINVTHFADDGHLDHIAEAVTGHFVQLSRAVVEVVVAGWHSI